MSFDLILPFLRPIEPFLLRDTVSEIMVNPDGSIWIEEGTRKARTEARFAPGALHTGLEVIANRFGRKLDRNSPILHLRLPDGSRLSAIIPPIVHPQPLLTIRKFTSRHFTLEDLITRGMLTEEQAAELSEAVRRGDNLLIAGATGTGKTTLLNVLADAIPEEDRVLIIEDTAELHIRKPHVIQLEAQIATHHTPIGFDDLLKAILRHRPDRILVGEVRGAEARTLIDAMNTGHRGTLATVHASGAQEAIGRLANLALASGDHPSRRRLEGELRRSLDAVVFLNRQKGTRAVEEILRLRRDGLGS
jgi:pilus assembly protein CpaF